MKFDYLIHEIPKTRAIAFVQSTHYSKVMPKLTKHYLGAFVEGELVGVLTLGWGTQPLQTIRKLFPDLKTDDYYEIGKLCMAESMPRNSESQFLSSVVRWMKHNCPEKAFLFTWADGIVGKPGYVYQASNFLYGGFIWTDIYLTEEGEKVHPRSAKALLRENLVFEHAHGRRLDKNRLFWLTKEFMVANGIRRVRGKQFRYIYPLNRRGKSQITRSTVEWSRNYPKNADLEWKILEKDGKYRKTRKMPQMNLEIADVNRKNVFSDVSESPIEHNFWE